MRNSTKMGGTVKKKMAKGGVIVASPIEGPRRKVAGSNMAKGGQTFPDFTGDGKVTKADVLKGRGVFKKGGTKKYQAGGAQSTVEKAKNVMTRVAKTPAKKAYLKDLINIDDAQRGTFSPKTFSSTVYKGVTDIDNIKDAARVIAKKSQHETKFKRAPHPSDTLGKPKYLKKKGGQAHPGFKAVQAKIAAKSGVSKQAAGAILAASTRKASAKAKAANPRLKRVK